MIEHLPSPITDHSEAKIYHYFFVLKMKYIIESIDIITAYNESKNLTVVNQMPASSIPSSHIYK